MPPPKTSGKNLESENYFIPHTTITSLCNTPLIDYTLELLAVASVQEAYLFCREHYEIIKDYINTIATSEARSVGDALRELDAKQLINSDLILIYGDVVSNIHLDKVFSELKCFINLLDGKTNKCVHCETVELYPRKRRMIMDMEVFKKHADVQIRNDHIDCQIDICSVEVPALFTENFDYQDVRKDFVYGILTSDLLEKTIYCHLVKDVYAARVRNLHAYDAISKDVLSRWTFPIVPDSNLQEGDNYEFMRGHIYKEKDVLLSRSCSLGEKILIGAGSEIAENVKITNSVIGRRVTIGPNVEIDGAYIWDGVKIKSNCSVFQSILANNVVLEENVIVKKGCILSYGVIIGPNVTLEPHTKLTKQKKTEIDSDEEESNESVVAYDATLVGENGQGYVWSDEISDADDDELDVKNIQVAGLAYDISNISLTDSDSPPSVIYDSSSDELSDSDESATEEESLKEFFKEVSQTLERAFLDGHTVEIALLELNTLRMASNTTFHDLRVSVIPTILGQINIDNFLTSTEDGHCAKTQHHSKLFAPTIKKLYFLDVLDEDAILEWNSSDLADDDPSKSNIKKRVAPFIKWLEEAEVEDSDDDD
ncbi:2809_t:CDS:10 [Cetraspora pellucida]|uniref:Translation initiation factor eIF2B subunit epsilon n=1 Tax=Cetraspora pellucida TaxID=1433469 RepID=A0A9N9IEG0_9GLOM|nr:2809_t:CDS:10 [Cetraspora pellucida]